MNRSLWLLFATCVSGLLVACGGGYGNITRGASTATHFSVNTPQDATTGASLSFTVTALDASNHTVSTYAGTVHFTSSDSQAVLPANSMLTNGVGTFSATLETTGSQTITATDTVSPTITGVSSVIQVSIAAPAGTFTATSKMNFARAGHTATLLKDGTVLITGGENTTGPLTSAEIFNASTGMFSPTGSMETARVGHTATLLTDGTVLVTGGTDATGALASAEIFDPATGIFAPTVGNMETPRVGHTATLLNDGTGRVLLAGGGTAPVVLIGPVTDPGTSTAELYDPKSGQFTPAGNNMLTSRIYLTATPLSTGDVLLAGGTDSSGNDLGDLFQSASATFTTTVTGGTTALHLSADLLRDGTVLLTGGELESSPCGEGGSLVSIRNALLFTSSDGNFSETGDMSTSRVSHTATLLAGGGVLIAGGATSNTPCNRGFGTSTFASIGSAELFNPSSGTFAPTGNMTTARAGHSATLLANGTAILVVGGIDGNGNVLASAELFQ